jgi:hypothetical protein
MSTRSSFVQPGDQADVGDEIVFISEHQTLVRVIVAERALGPLSQRMRYRVVDFASEMFDPEAGRWLDHDQVYMIHPALR